MRANPFEPRWAQPLLVAAAAVAAFAGLTTKSFWFDEGYSAELAREPLASWWSLLWSQEAGSILHAVMLKVIVLFTDSDLALRAPSAVAAVLAVVLTVRLAAHVSSTRTALVAGALLIVNGTWVAYAQEARTYSLAMVTILAATLALLHEQAQRSTSSALLYVLVAIVAMYTHALAVLWLLAHGCYVLLTDRAHLGRWVTIGLGLIAGFMPLAIGMAVAGYTETQDSAVKPPSDPALFVHIARIVLAPSRIVGLVLLAVVLIGTARTAFDRLASGSVLRDNTAWLLIALCVGVPMLAGFATVGLAHVRWYVPIVPFMLILVAQAVPSPDRWLSALPAMGLVLLSATGLFHWHTTAEKVDARAWSSLLERDAVAGDTVAFDATFGRIVTEHYLARRDVTLPGVETTPQPEAFGTYFWNPERDRLGECLLDEDRVDELVRDTTSGSLWLVVAEPTGCPSGDRLREHLTEQGHEIEFRALDGPASLIEIPR